MMTCYVADRCVYERSPYAPTLATFMVSAWWHGFYPGYYLTFIYIGVMVEAARKVRMYIHIAIILHSFGLAWVQGTRYKARCWAVT